jgi:hypothetical protein
VLINEGKRIDGRDLYVLADRFSDAVGALDASGANATMVGEEDRPKLVEPFSQSLVAARGGERSEPPLMNVKKVLTKRCRASGPGC